MASVGKSSSRSKEDRDFWRIVRARKKYATEHLAGLSERYQNMLPFTDDEGELRKAEATIRHAFAAESSNRHPTEGSQQ